MTFDILNRESANIFVNLATKDYREIRKLMIAAVLYTDMVRAPPSPL